MRTVPFVGSSSLQQPLHFHVHAADAVGFVPVQLGLDNSSVRKLDERLAL